MECLNAAGQRVNLLNTSPSASYFSQPHQHHHHHHRPRLAWRSSTSASSISTASINTQSTISTVGTARSTRTTATSTTIALSPPPRRSDNASSGFSSPLPTSTSTPLLSRQHSSSSPFSSPSSSPHTPARMPSHNAFDAADAQKGISSADPTERFYRPNADTYYLPAHSQQPQQRQQQQQQQQQQQPAFAMRSDLLMKQSSFSSLPAAPSAPAATFGYATDLIDPITPQSAATLSLQPSTPTDVATPATQKAKKKYPCPHSQRFHCSDTFTTSGHAARHGKKHTGEKNVLCPTCQKAFTRKDNMRQHERTHRKDQVHLTSNSATDADSSAAISDRGFPSSLAISSSKSTAGSSEFDMDLDSNAFLDSTSPPADFSTDLKSIDLESFAPTKTTNVTNLQPRSSSSRLQSQRSRAESSYTASLSIDVPLAEKARPNLDRKYTETSQDGEGESPGLDALAMVASGLA